MTVGGREFYVYRYEGKLNDIPNAAVILSYPKEAFGNPRALRVFISTNAELSTQEILDTYSRRWPIELFFRQSKGKLALDKYQIRSRKGIRRYWLIMSLVHYGLKYSYIYNCTTKSEEFLKGYETFIRTAAVLKSLRTLRIAKIGERPVPFMSVMTNEANLIKRFGITTVPISPVEICNRARKILEEKGKEYIKYEEEFVRKFPDGENYQQICATKLAVQELMEENNCSVAAFECWSAFPTLMGLCPCVVLGEMADNGMPLSCETDINGAITLAILRACNLFEESEFLADLTIRHPQNDNAELLWHCGPFPYSLKKDGVEAKLVDGQERFELKQGDLTVCRFDDVDGEYYLFAGEAKTTTGPETNGTYVWMETDNWKRWEEKLMFGPYIHHLGCVYGHYLPVLREVSRYLGIHFDNAHEQGIYSL